MAFWSMAQKLINLKSIQAKLQNQNPSSCSLFLLHERLGAALFSAQICFIKKKMGIETLLSHTLPLFEESQQRVRDAGTADMALVN